MFLGKGLDSEMVFVFKMSKVGPASGVDLVKQMQSGGDIQDLRNIFDHVKHVKHWTTMACHVYESTYCWIITVAVYDMHSEDTGAQSILWKNLNTVMARHGIPKSIFKGFMADNALAN
jgi:hypothetical protein